MVDFFIFSKVKFWKKTESNYNQNNLALLTPKFEKYFTVFDNRD